MAGPRGEYFIQDELDSIAAHHVSFQVLWETKWKQLCALGVYPFMFGAIQDFEPVVEEIIKVRSHTLQKGLKEPYDWDEYAECFFPKAEDLIERAMVAEQHGNREEASELYLRGSALYRIARFPIPRSKQQQHAWSKGKEAARKGLLLHKYPMVQVDIPHTHAVQGEGGFLPGFFHLPERTSSSHKAPLVVIFTGLDAYRTELAAWKEGWRQVGCATLIVEVPGTGDNPGSPSDPTSPDRVWDSMFEWIAQQEAIDQTRIVNWGFSTGGFYSIRLAHTHPDKLKGVVAHGGGCHYMFSPEWLENADNREYTFDFVPKQRHMGGPQASVIILEWLSQLLGIQIDVDRFMSTIPSKPKY
ncbi:pigment biosynthesis protein ayg1 [Seiridium cupressi]